MVPRCYPPIGRPIGTPPCDTHITWPWRLRPAVSYQSSGAASAPGGNTPRALYGAGADGHPEAPDRRPLGACPYRRQCAECSPSNFIDSLFQTVMGGPPHISQSPRKRFDPKPLRRTSGPFSASAQGATRVHRLSVRRRSLSRSNGLPGERSPRADIKLQRRASVRHAEVAADGLI